MTKEGSLKSKIVIALVVIVAVCAIIGIFVETASPVKVVGSTGGSTIKVNATGLQVGNEQWPSFTYDYNNSRFQNRSLINASDVGELNLIWSIPTPYGVTSTPVVQRGKVFFADSGGNAYAANLTSGKVIWQRNIGNTITSSALADNDTVYFAGDYDPPAVYALSAASGSAIWNTTLPSSSDDVWGSPVVYNGRLYIGVANDGTDQGENNSLLVGQVFALNAQNGKILWHFNTTVSGADNGAGGGGVWSSVVVDPKLNAVYFDTGNSYSYNGYAVCSYCVISLNATTGRLNWEYQVYPNQTIGQDQDFGSTPNLFRAVFNGITYNAIGAGNKNGIYYILNRDNGTLLDSFQIGTAWPGPVSGGIIGLGGFEYPNSSDVNPTIFIPASNYDTPPFNGTVAALDLATDKVSWNFHTNGKLFGSVAVVPGAVLVGDSAGNLYAISTSNGTTLLQYTFSSPIGGGVSVAGKYVLVGTYNKKFIRSPALAVGVYAFST
ncbi:MAG: PQQ-binding-like beta-propeller repeat protein [Candidatus Micrarchaeota archaeon]|nr:PQQ-binding-like beta-propeller repeat protein [Candidatus Micrarchaeota archaeon]MDE1859605.1 PQQ-binding-like beta-propeller repeat protein [Candidatus Micrarchaeota archaeon]